ncbi:GNAT family N-acetyltransferase [Microbulbifer sp. JMSA008]|uniref:GNAT family N-acetyltransferase n=1 Tax=Microbulbifer sp. JMSA008 TaxID=3243373 RepID=UPI0040391621
MRESLFTTNRLIFRKWRDSDLSMIQKVYGDSEAMRWVGDGNTLSYEESKAWLKVTHNNYMSRGYGMFAVELKNTLEVIGFCGIVHPNDQVDPEIKYAFSRDYWGQGMATEAVVGLIDYATIAFGIGKFIATIAPENIASERVLLKAGMLQGGICNDDEGIPAKCFYFNTQPSV